MNRFTLSLFGFAAFRPTVLIDGKTVQCKKNAYGNYTCTLETDKKSVNVTVCKYLEINGRFWFLFSLLFFIIGVIGIFDPPYDKRCLTFECRFDAILSGNSEVAVRYVPQGAGAAIGIEGNCPLVQLANRCFIDMRAKKRLKIMRAVKIILVLAAVAAVVACILSAVL